MAELAAVVVVRRTSGDSFPELGLNFLNENEFVDEADAENGDALLLAEHGQGHRRQHQEVVEDPFRKGSSLGGGRLSVDHQGEEEEDRAEEFCSADDPGHSLGVDRVHREEDRRDRSHRFRNRK